MSTHATWYYDHDLHHHYQMESKADHKPPVVGLVNIITVTYVIIMIISNAFFII